MQQEVSRIEKSTSRRPDKRYFVPDFSPQDRSALKKMKPRYIFVAESPHINEVESDVLEERRPLCGAAGRQWWGLLSELLEGQTNTDVELKRILKFCLDHQIVVMNAVQFPLDPKIDKLFPGAEPVKNLGFSKLNGAYSFKKLKNTRSVQDAVSSLGERLQHPSLKDVPIHCLGNDSEWFVSRALGASEIALRLGEKIPHPSAWWRRGGLFGKMARERLSRIFKIQ